MFLNAPMHALRFAPKILAAPENAWSIMVVNHVKSIAKKIAFVLRMGFALGWIVFCQGM
jgi:hypothetical protein